jgi:hypothetical protein
MWSYSIVAVKVECIVSDKPTTDNHDEWNIYWAEQGEEWRTEPEIDDQRQAYLKERLTIPVDEQSGIYPFKDIRLTRADIEWLLHEHGPIHWNDESQREREGLDLRGAILGKTEFLACLFH